PHDLPEGCRMRSDLATITVVPETFPTDDQLEPVVPAVFSTHSTGSPRTLLDVLAQTARRYPHAGALDDGRTVLHYRGLLGEVEQLRGLLAGHGIGRGDRVGVRVPSGTGDL